MIHRPLPRIAKRTSDHLRQGGLTLSILEETFAICKLPPNHVIPDWAQADPMTAITATEDDLSIVCAARLIPPQVQAERDWKCLKVSGPLTDGLPRILAVIAVPLAQARISIFAFPKLNAVYVLLRQDDVPRVRDSLIRAGHRVLSSA